MQNPSMQVQALFSMSGWKLLEVAPDLAGWSPLPAIPDLAGWSSLPAPPDLAGWRPLLQQPPHTWHQMPSRPRTGCLRVRTLPSGTTSASLEEEGWCSDQIAMPWQSKMVAHWQEGSREDWNNVIHFFEKVYSIQAVRVGTAVRFKWSDMRLAQMMPSQHPPLFGVRSLSASMLVLDVDLAFQAGDLWTVVEASLSVAVFAVATEQPHLGDHSWLKLTRRDVSSSFQFPVLSDVVKDWIDSLTSTFLKFCPQSVAPHDFHVITTWER